MPPVDAETRGMEAGCDRAPVSRLACPIETLANRGQGNGQPGTGGLRREVVEREDKCGRSGLDCNVARMWRVWENTPISMVRSALPPPSGPAWKPGEGCRCRRRDWRCHARHIKAGMCAQSSGTDGLGLGLLPLALVSPNVSGIWLPAYYCR